MESSRCGVESFCSGGRFTLGKQSCHLPELAGGASSSGDELTEKIDQHFLLMYLAHEGDVGGIQELIGAGVDVNFCDIDGRTALHVASCQGSLSVVDLLLRSGAQVDSKDRWGSTPLVDAIHHHKHQVIKLLEKYGAKLQVVPMHVKGAPWVPEYEINSREFDFSKSVDIAKGTYRTAKWRGIRVAVKTFAEDLIEDDDKVRAFRDELALLQQIRHPNVVQFLGAVTQSSPMMIVTEYLPKGDFRSYLRRKGALKLSTAVRFALDIARGMNYLHEHRPEAIIHGDLEPTLIEQCWSDNPAERPTFSEIIYRLSSIQKHIALRKRWKVMPMLCFQNLEAVWRRESLELRTQSSSSSFSSNSTF